MADITQSNMDTDQIIQNGIQSLRQGNFPDAVTALNRLMKGASESNAWLPYQEMVYRIMIEMDDDPVKNPVLDASMEHPDVLISLLNTAIEGGEIQRALNWSDQYISHEPVEPLGRIIRVDILRVLYQQALESGEHSKAQGYLQAAIEDLLALQQMEPEAAWAWLTMGKIKYALGDSKSAIDQYSRAIELDVDNLEAHTERGWIALNQDDHSLALQDFSYLVQMSPESATAYRLRGEAFAGLKKYEQALADFDRAIALDQKDVDAYLGKSRVMALTSQSMDSEVLNAYSKALEIDPEYAETYYQRALFFLERQEYQKAVDDLNQVIRLVPSSKYGYYMRAEALHAKGEIDRSLEDYSKAIELDPAFLEAYLGRARVFITRDEFDMAMTDYKTASEVDPNYSLVYFDRGMLFIELNQIKNAVSDFDRAINIDPQNPMAYQARAEAYISLENLNQALEDYNHAIALDSHQALWFVRRGWLRAHLGEQDEALQDYQVALHLDPKNAEAVFNLGVLHLERNEYDQALEDFRLYTEIDPENSSGYRLLGEALLRKNEYQLAMQSFNNAIRLAPQSSDAYLGRARLYLALAEKEFDGRTQGGTQEFISAEHMNPNLLKAFQDFDQALKLDPDNIWAYRERADLYWQIADLSDQPEQILQSYERALLDVDQLLRLEPTQAINYVVQGDLRTLLRQYTTALESYSKAIQLEPQMVEAYIGRALIHRDQGNFSQALNGLEAVLNINPNLANVYIVRGDILTAMDDYHHALWEYERALEIEPENPLALRGRGLANLGVGDDYRNRRVFDKMKVAYLAAKLDLERTLDHDLKDETTYWYYGLTMRVLEGYDAATHAFDQAMDLVKDGDPALTALLLGEKGETFRRWGSILHNSERLQDAMRAYNRALEEAPDHTQVTWIHSFKGVVLLKLGRYDQALALFMQNIERDPGDIWSYVGLGQTYYVKKEYKQTLDVLNRLLSLSVEDLRARSYAYVGYGLSWEKLGDTEQASKAYQQALEELHEFSGIDLYLERAAVFEDYMDITGYQHAEADRKEALSWGEKWGEVLNSLAWLYTDKMPTSLNLNKAANLAARAVEAEGQGINRAKYLDTLGWAYFCMGNRYLALKYLEEAIDLNDYDMIIRSHYQEAKNAMQESPMIPAQEV